MKKLNKLNWLFLLTVLIAQHPEHVEVFFEVIGDEEVMFEASAESPTYLPIGEANQDIPPEIQYGSHSIMISVNPEEEIGFNFLLAGNDPPDNYPVMRYGVYEITNENDNSYFLEFNA